MTSTLDMPEMVWQSIMSFMTRAHAPPSVDDLVQETKDQFGVTVPRDMVEGIYDRCSMLGIIPPAEAFGPDDEDEYDAAVNDGDDYYDEDDD